MYNFSLDKQSLVIFLLPDFTSFARCGADRIAAVGKTASPKDSTNGD